MNKKELTAKINNLTITNEDIVNNPELIKQLLFAHMNPTLTAFKEPGVPIVHIKNIDGSSISEDDIRTYDELRELVNQVKNEDGTINILQFLCDNRVPVFASQLIIVLLELVISNLNNQYCDCEGCNAEKPITH